ncbi:MAG: entericidin A/B family lipoprotein [Sedimentisphaerales bacterium]|nr:entericidin A/B family lipoprotein [Sedimentisphaerales bacterium]
MGKVKRYVIFLMTALMLGSVALTGCNTVRGAGEDIEAGGEAIQDAAD